MTPAFVKVDSGDWRSFPAAGGYVAVQAGHVLLRSGDGRRSLALTLPEDWSLRGDAPASTRFTHIGPTGNEILPASTRLRFEAPHGTASAEIELGAGATLRLVIQATGPADWPDVLLDVRGDETGGAQALLPMVGDAADAWVSLGGARFHLPPPVSANDGSLVLQQKLVFGTFLGGALGESIRDVIVDDAGQLILAGTTGSLDFPVLPGAFDAQGDTQFDGFLAGMTPDGSELTFATFLGGSAADWILSSARDDDGSIVVTGGTSSLDLPATPGAFDTTFNGGTEDSFVARLSGDGSTLLACTYIGGSGLGSDYAGQMRIDPLDASIVIAGRTCSSDWPTTPGSFAPENASIGDCDIFVSRLSPDLSTMIASTYYGGIFNDGLDGMDVLADGTVIFSGNNVADDAPITLTRGVFAGSGRSSLGYLVRLAADLSSQVWSTWVPGGIERILATEGGIVLVGSTNDPAFPITPGAAIPAFSGTAGAWFA